EAPRDALAHRELSKRHVRLAERLAMPVVPRRVERLAVALEAEGTSALARDNAEAVTRVEVVDAGQGRQLEPRVARVVVEGQRSGADDRVIRDAPRDFEISLDRRILDELHVAEVRESLAADRIARRVDRSEEHTSELQSRE